MQKEPSTKSPNEGSNRVGRSKYLRITGDGKIPFLEGKRGNHLVVTLKDKPLRKV
jgi:hypothetical protein